ncbi:hypothetical protein B9Z55_019348 [Caenorhabditis nigoni]|uniref:Uncharacterized protein n=1 Tax=Caenorhabditis nigoni TaxID=1611254 RepID=A0A2G5THZ9_9PELO|nr:hypothetical protein B9Z55_019348 [Caenorhabditis nigoni]
MIKRTNLYHHFRFGNPSHDMMDVTSSGQPPQQTVKSEMLSPLKMDQLDPSKQVPSPTFLSMSSSLLLKQQQLQHKKSHHNVPSRKASIMALKR